MRKKCHSIPKEITNYFKTSAKKGATNLPIGVEQNGKKFRARIAVYGCKKTLGNFDTTEQAEKAYWDSKYNLIKQACQWGLKNQMITEQEYDRLTGWIYGEPLPFKTKTETKKQETENEDQNFYTVP